MGAADLHMGADTGGKFGACNCAFRKMPPGGRAKVSQCNPCKGCSKTHHKDSSYFCIQWQNCFLTCQPHVLPMKSEMGELILSSFGWDCKSKTCAKKKALTFSLLAEKVNIPIFSSLSFFPCFFSFSSS